MAEERTRTELSTGQIEKLNTVLNEVVSTVEEMPFSKTDIRNKVAPLNRRIVVFKEFLSTVEQGAVKQKAKTLPSLIKEKMKDGSLSDEQIKQIEGVLNG